MLFYIRRLGKLFEPRDEVTSDLAERKVLLGFAVSLLCLMGIGLAAYWSVTDLQRDMDWITKQNEVILTLDRLDMEIDDAESAHDDFVLKNSEESHQKMLQAHKEAETCLVSLQQITEHNPEQQIYLGQVLPLWHKMIAFEQDHLIHRADKGQKGTPVVEENPHQPELSDRIEKIIGKMIELEKAQMLARHKNSDASSQRTLGIITFGGCFSFLLVALALYVIGKDFAGSRRAARQLVEAKANLEERVHQRTLDLEESQARLQLALDAAQIGQWDMDLKTLETRCSLKHDQILGFPNGIKEWNYRHFMERVHPEDRAMVDQQFRDLVDSGLTSDFECRIVTPEGETRWIWDRGIVFRNAEGKAVRVVGMVWDITARKKSEIVLAQLAAIVDSSQDAIIGKDLNGNITSWNQGAEKIFGYTPGEIIGHPMTRLIPEDRQNEEPEILRQICGGATMRHFETVRRHKSGLEIHVSLTISAVRNREGKVVGASHIARDITERHKSEEDIRVSHQRFLMVSKATNDAVWDWNIPSGQLWWNESFEGLFGYAHEDRDSSIEAWKSMVHPEDHERVARQLRELIDRGENIWVDEYRLRRKDGTYADVLDRGYVIRNEAGKAIRMIGAVMDITERKQYEKEILRLNTELENRVKQRTTELEVANQELEAFSYSISHDLRAPLRTINGFSRVVQEDFAGVLPNEGRRQLQIIRNGAEKMGVLIDDLLKFSRLSRLPLRKSEVNTMGLVEQVLAETSELRAGREIQITVHPLPSCLADPSLLKQVWVNLLSNAFKYTQQQSRPEVVIGCRTDAGEKTFFIRDNGTGFDMRYAGKLFGVFQRLHRSDEFEGTGVGLAIVQRIVHRHGGRVWAEAKPGEGATFFFSLDQEKPNESGSKH